MVNSEFRMVNWLVGFGNGRVFRWELKCRVGVPQGLRAGDPDDIGTLSGQSSDNLEIKITWQYKVKCVCLIAAGLAM